MMARFSRGILVTRWLKTKSRVEKIKLNPRQLTTGGDFLFVGSSNPDLNSQISLVLPFRMKGTSPSRASRALEGLRFTATQCHDGEDKLFINLV